MAIEFTKAQQRAIETEGNVLVSAAAGSGKTAVLVERVITLMTRKENPIAADRLLIVTFTNAAAAEMRLRIESRLDEVCRENPQDRGLLRQKRLLANAKICTIDSFCIDLVRENFEKAGVSPDFKMSDAISLKAIDERVMAEITNEYIESKNEIFFELLDIIGAEYDERNFNEKVLEIYNYSRQLPEPEKWFKSFCEPFGKAFDKHNIWYNYSFDAAIKKIKSLRKSLAIIIDKIGLYEAASERFMPTLMLLSELLYELEKTAEKRVWNDFREKLLSFNLPEKPNARGFGGICVVSAVKTLFETISKGTEKLKKLFERSAEENEEQFIYLDKPISLLCEILICLQERLLEEYLKENTLTFHNTEHLALKLLTQTEGEEFLNLYDEVMVDEYQDTNDLQDRLFYVLSAYERKLFAVGDVKQSIYGFRGANPINFLEKKNRYIAIDEAKQDDAKKIILSNNFRSNEEICSFVNFFFENIMTEENAGLDYGEEERLVASADYRENEKAVELQVIDCKDSENSSAVCEALAIAKYIKSVMNSGECIKKDKDSYREAKFSDFAILMRATKNKADKLAEILRQCGIPVNFSVEGFAERNEIATILSLLKVIDNPHSDIELACVMLSPVFGFTPEELANIRGDFKKGDFYSAVAYAQKNDNEHVKTFIKRIEEYRMLSLTLNLPKFISRLIYDSGYINMVSAMEEGTTRRNNLLLLVKYANDYSGTNTGSISSFVNYIRSQSEKGMKSAVNNVGGNTVKIMSIHASKGLQFPICIVAGTSSAFNNDYNKNAVTYRSDFGIGLKFFDEKEGKRATTVGYEVMGELSKKETLAEELRLLYVAMTRAQERLLFTATVSDAEKKCADICERLLLSDGEISFELFERTSSFSDWLLVAGALHKSGKAIRGESSDIIPMDSDSCFNLEIISEEEIREEAEDLPEEIFTADDNLALKIAQNTAFQYPFEKVREIEAKASVSAVANKAEGERFAFSEIPSCLSKGGVTATDRGTAMHKIMQFIDFSKKGDLKGEIERLYEWQFISENEAKAANLEALNTFFSSDIFGRIEKADELHREMRFLTEFDANVLSKEAEKTGEKIIIQGAVDLCFKEADSIVILDFKTDRVTDEKQLIEAYAEQLRYYALACEKVFGLPVKEKIIYSFCLGKEIRL